LTLPVKPLGDVVEKASFIDIFATSPPLVSFNIDD
jgi:hypothetical protein